MILHAEPAKVLFGIRPGAGSHIDLRAAAASSSQAKICPGRVDYAFRESHLNRALDRRFARMIRLLGFPEPFSLPG